MKKTAKKKTRIESIIDLVDCHLDGEITQDELVSKLLKVVDKPIIKFFGEWSVKEGVIISEMEYKVSEWKDNVYLESRNTDIHGQKSDWVQVEDLTELRVWEYNELVDKLQKHYPDYPIEYLEGRFV